MSGSISLISQTAQTPPYSSPTISFSLCQMAPEGAAVAFTRARHSVLFNASRPAVKLTPAFILMSSVHGVAGRPLPCTTAFNCTLQD